MSDLVATRSSLHAVAELLLAGPQYERSGTIRLRVTTGGFGTVAAPDARVEGVALRCGEQTIELRGRTVGEVAEAAGLVSRPLDDVYADGCGLTVDHPLLVVASCAAEIAEAFRLGDEALAALAADAPRIIWPEHFDLGISVSEVNFGVSPGDDQLPVPYAYVGPWNAAELTGAFWNAPFGAARPVAELGGADGLLEFFREGQGLS